MAKQRSVFEEGARENGIDGELAMKIFDWWRNSPVAGLTNRTPPLMRWFLTRRYG